MKLTDILSRGRYASPDDYFPGGYGGYHPPEYEPDGYDDSDAYDPDQGYDGGSYADWPDDGYEPDDYDTYDRGAYDQGHSGYGEPSPADLAAYLQQQIHAGHGQVLGLVGHLVKPMVENEAVHAIAGDLGPEAQSYVRNQLANVDALSIKGLMGNPQVMEFFRHAAQGAMFASPPQGSGVFHSYGGNVDSGAEGEINQYMKAMERVGLPISREQAMRTYQREMANRRGGY